MIYDKLDKTALIALLKEQTLCKECTRLDGNYCPFWDKELDEHDIPTSGCSWGVPK